MIDKESYNYHGFEKDEEKARMLSNSDSSFDGSNSIGFSSSVEVPKEKSTSGTKVPSPMRKFVVMFACFYTMLTTFGMSVAYGLIYVELIEVFQSSRAVAASVSSTFVGLSLAGGVLFSRFIMKYNVGICVMIASTVGFFSMACASLSPNIETVIVLMGVVSGLCASVNILSAYSLVSWFFVDEKKSALSILTLGASLGQSFIPYLTSALIQEYHWNGCVLIMSALFVFNGVPCGLIMSINKDYYRKSTASVPKSPMSSLRNILSDKVFLFFLFTLCLTILFGSVEPWFVADIAALKEFGAGTGAVLLSLNGIFGIVSRVISSIVFKVFPNTRAELHITYAYVLWCVAHIIVVMSPVFWGAFLGMFVRGFSVGILFSCMPSLQLELRGADLFPQTMAISNLVCGVCNVLGGMFGGYVTDISGSYNLIFYIAASSACICAVDMLIIMAALKRRKRSNDYQQL